ncbi:interferon alpha-inducible protein 27-like protein 2A [Saccostrea cucullata]|uniref:interferon alpha-inducible protein 27-like protein 2A n=1 Tax=Saccostrea cuccullata TaxID=36930 RepID=UPI002ED26D73
MIERTFRATCFVVLLLFYCPGAGGEDEARIAACMAAALGLAAGTSWFLLPLLGFTSTGISARSIAAHLMSLSATANGGAVAAGSWVSFLQSLGATGITPYMVKILEKAYDICLVAVRVTK